MSTTLIVLLLAAVIAFWISALCGGGASLILLPLLNILLPISVVPFSLTIGTFASSISRIYVFRKHIYWPIFFWFVPFLLPAVGLGAYLLKFVNPIYIQVLIALFLLINVSELFKTKIETFAVQKHWGIQSGITGFFAGLLSGLTGAVGLLFNRFYLKLGLSKEQVIATRAVNEVFLHLIKLVIYIYIGVYSQSAFILGLAIAAASVVSAVTVKHILPLVSEYWFKKVAYGFMAFSGVILLYNSSSQIVLANNVRFINTYSGNNYEAGLVWQGNHFTLEYSNGGVEFEKSISYNDLPNHLQKRYNDMALVYDDIKLEKVFSMADAEYELHACKGSHHYKFEYQ